MPLIETLHQDRLTLTQTLSTANGTIAQGHLAVNNQKDVNQWYLETLGASETSLSPVQEQALLLIAEQCPYSGGHAVYRAQAMLEHYEKSYQKSDCGASQALQQSISPELPNVAHQAFVAETVAEAIRIYPNPSNGYLTIDLPSSDNDWEIRLIDLQGKTLQTINGISRHLKADFSKFPAGVYFLKFRSQEQSLTKRVVLN